MGKLDNEFLGQITSLYTYLKEKYPDNEVYFSEYLNNPSCCIEDKDNKYEWHIVRNPMQNDEIWLKHGKENKKEESGMGYGEKLENVIEQAEAFLKEAGFKAPLKQITLFDFIY